MGKQKTKKASELNTLVLVGTPSSGFTKSALTWHVFWQIAVDLVRR
jgi:hypothetical protein